MEAFATLVRQRDDMRNAQERLEDRAALAMLKEMRGFFERHTEALEFQDQMGLLVLRMRRNDQELREWCGYDMDHFGYVATEEDRLYDDFIQPPTYVDQYSPDRRTVAGKELYSLYEGACDAVDKEAVCSLLWLNDDGKVNRDNLERLIGEQEFRVTGIAPKLHWRDVRDGDPVAREGATYKVGAALVYWNGSEAQAAFKKLDGIIKKAQRKKKA